MKGDLGDVQSRPQLGFWSCWSLTVGVMIGSGIFTLPAVLAPYGMMSFAGWVTTAFGTILLAFTLGRLAGRTKRTGGPYVYAHDAFGDLAGFLVAWGYWASLWIAIAAIAITFVGYLSVFVPAIGANSQLQLLTALILIWALTFVSIKGVKEASWVQVATTLAKLVPLLTVIVFGVTDGQGNRLPAVNPTGEPIFAVLATTALLTMWAFVGLEAGTMPAGNIKNPEKTIPRAVLLGTLTVAFVYLASTAAVMALVPSDLLAQSTSPFADAARAVATWGAGFVAIGAMVSTLGALNGNIFLAGQLPMAVAIDRLAPPFLAKKNRGDAPVNALILATVLASILLILNFSRGFIGAFTFLALMSTLSSLTALFASAAAELKYSWKSARGWAGVALLALLYMTFAILGSGLEVIGWGLVLFACGLPVYFIGRSSK